MPELHRSPAAAGSRTRPSCWRRPAAARCRACRHARSSGAAARRRSATRAAKPSTTAVLPTPASPVRIGLFCRRRIRMSMICRISSSRPVTGSSWPFRGSLGEVGRKALERFLLPHLRRRHRLAGFARPCQRSALGRRERILGRPFDDACEIVGQRLDLDGFEVPRNRHQRIAKRRRLEHPDHQVPGAHARRRRTSGSRRPIPARPRSRCAWRSQKWRSPRAAADRAPR